MVSSYRGRETIKRSIICGQLVGAARKFSPKMILKVEFCMTGIIEPGSPEESNPFGL